MGDRNYDPEQLNYNLFIFRAKKCIRDFLEAGNVDLDRLKEIFYNLNAESPTLNQQINQATTVEKIVQTLEDHRIININDVSLLGRLAEELNLEDLQKAVDNYDWYHSQGIRRIALRLKAVLSNRSVQRLAGTAILVALYSERRELWEAIGETLPEAVRLTGVMEGSIAFVVESSSLSALKELWSSFKDGSLQENIKKALNNTKEVREVFNGEEIDVEVTIDEDEYRDACWNAVLLQMADRYKPTEESSFVGREHSHSSCDMDLPRNTMTGLAWSDWINVREIYNKSRIESKKRRKAENKVAELARDLHGLKNAREHLVSKTIFELRSRELQRIREEMKEVKSKLLAKQELLSNQLDPLWKSKPEELLKVFQQLTADLIKKAPNTVDVVTESLISELSKKILSHPELDLDVLIQMIHILYEKGSQPWYFRDDATKLKLTSCIETVMTSFAERLASHPELSDDALIQIMQEYTKLLTTLQLDHLDESRTIKLTSVIEPVMTSVAERLVKHPDLSTDVLIQVMHENAKILQELPFWYRFDKRSKMKMISGIETMMTSVAERLANHPDLSTDVLIQVMQENTNTLQKLPWNGLDDGSKMKVTSGIEAMMTSVAERFAKHPDLSTDVLIQVMQENTKVLEKLPLNKIDDGNIMKLGSILETMMTSVSQRLINHPDLSTNVLIKVMQENTKVLQKLPWDKLDEGSTMKMISGIETMMTSFAERLANHPDLSTDELIQLMQENTNVLQQLRWYLLDDISKMKLTSAIETLMNSITKRLDNHSDLTTDVLIKVMQENTKVLEKLPWENIDDDSKFKLSSDLESMIKHVIQHLTKHPEISNDVFKAILCISEAILKKISWTDLNSDLQNHVLSCLAELMKLVSNRDLHHYGREVVTDAVSIILAMSSLLPQSSDIASQLQSHLEPMVASVAKSVFPFRNMDEVKNMMITALKASNKLSSEATLVILSIASRIMKAYLGQATSFWSRQGFERKSLDVGVTRRFMSLLQDVGRFLPENLTSFSDVKELKSQVDSHVGTLDRVLLHFNDIQVKSTESDQPFILDEVVSGIKEELSKLKKELANMIRIFERKSEHGHEFKESIQALIERFEVKQKEEEMRPHEERLMLQRKHEESMGFWERFKEMMQKGPSETKSKEQMTTGLPSKTSTVLGERLTSEPSEATMFKKKTTSGAYEMSETSGPSETKSKEKMTTGPQLHEDEPIP